MEHRKEPAFFALYPVASDDLQLALRSLAFLSDLERIWTAENPEAQFPNIDIQLKERVSVGIKDSNSLLGVPVLDPNICVEKNQIDVLRVLRD